ncbi:amino acid permease [Streptomyces anulatus]|uniref:amino acid permease n=1 Tax=Streptomyces TaxID=1883 RepID=UPI00200F2D5D|nr:MULTISPECIES: amino acid permease [Streptomyces]WSC59550.1 amino acid permease [Streptomyces anulatus]WTC67821.1 amino acid permease [Streptomyces anulatus]WUC91187.1 amino acid permease [Streptomyces anulatus]WUD93476.1 amino acid permease [Streptomyces anulatus]
MEDQREGVVWIFALICDRCIPRAAAMLDCVAFWSSTSRISAAPSSIWLAMSVVMFAYAGFEVVAIASAEAADPQRTIGTAMRQLAWRLSFFYLLSITLVLALIPWRRMADGDGSVEASPFVRVFSEIGVPAAATVTNAVVLIAAMSAANAHLYGASRLLHSLGDDGLAPKPLARLGRVRADSLQGHRLRSLSNACTEIRWRIRSLVDRTDMECVE